MRIVRVDAIEEVDVFVCMELCHFPLSSRFGSLEKSSAHGCHGSRGVVLLSAHKDLHLLIQPIVHDQRMTHPYSRWLHGVTSPVVVVSDIGIEKVALCLHQRAPRWS